MFTAYIECTDNEIDLTEKLKNINLEEIKKNLPAGIELPESLQNVNITSSIEVAKKVVQDKCSKVSGGDAAYKAIEEGAKVLQNCTSGLIEFSVLQEEIQKAEPNGELDTVFNK